MALRKRTNAYWQKRSTERVALLERQSEPYIRKVNGIYADAQRDMIQQMKAVYSGYYTSQGWDKQALNSIAPTGDIKQFKAEMKRLGLNTKLPARYKGRLTRLELLYAQMWGNAKTAGAKELALSHANYAALYENSYNLSVYEVSKGLTRTPAFTKLPTTQIEAALRHQFMGKNYSQRIWKNTNDLALQLQKEVAKTIITGESPQKASKRLRERYGVAKYKAERLMRTETARFQNEGTADAHQSMGLDNWRWSATLDSRTDIDCGERENHVYSYSAGDIQPPLHANCVLPDTIVYAPDATELMRTWYSGDVFKLSTANGRTLSVTANHIMLTARGWVRAKDIVKGDKVVNYGGWDELLKTSPTNDHSKVSVENLFTSLVKDPSVTTTSMPATTKDFKGDGIKDEEINIVRTDGLLRDKVDATFSKLFSDKALMFRGKGGETSLSTRSTFTQLLGAISLAANGSMSSSGVLSTLFGGSSSSQESISLSATSEYNTRLTQSSGDNLAAVSGALVDTVDSLSGVITFDDVVEVTNDYFSGHVYDLSTMSTLYTANGLLTSNCRCSLVAYLPAGLEPSVRIARGKDGKNYYTANMSYEQWAEAYL